MIKRMCLAAAAGIASVAPASATIVDLHFSVSASQPSIGAVFDGNFHITFDNADSFGPTTSGITFVGTAFGDGPFKMAYDADFDELQIGNALETWDDPNRNSTYYTIQPVEFFTSEGVEEGLSGTGTYGFFFLHADPEGDYWDLKGGQASVTFLADSTPGVPEPASWGLMVGGFGAIGGALRARKRSKLRFA